MGLIKKRRRVVLCELPDACVRDGTLSVSLRYGCVYAVLMAGGYAVRFHGQQMPSGRPLPV